MNDEYELNSDGLTEAWNFPALAHSENELCGLVYDIEETADTTEPCIEQGKILLPIYSRNECQCVLAQYNNEQYDDIAGKLAGIKYTSDLEEARIVDGVIELTHAEYQPDDTSAASNRVGGIKSIKASSVNAPYIDNGEIVIPKIPEIPSSEITIKQEKDSVPSPDVDGWITTMYMPMVYVNGDSGVISFRQLMRIYNGELQISFQRAIHPNGSWEPYFSAYNL